MSLPQSSGGLQPKSFAVVANQVTALQAHFHTIDDDKDDGNGISEMYLRDGSLVMGQNTSYHKDLWFKPGYHNDGEAFSVSPYELTLQNLNRVTYSFTMDNDDGWNVRISIYAVSGGERYLVADQLWNLGNGNHRHGSMQLSAVSPVQMEAVKLTGAPAERLGG